MFYEIFFLLLLFPHLHYTENVRRATVTLRSKNEKEVEAAIEDLKRLAEDGMPDY